jgi:hypothetical protein
MKTTAAMEVAMEALEAHGAYEAGVNQHQHQGAGAVLLFAGASRVMQDTAYSALGFGLVLLVLLFCGFPFSCCLMLFDWLVLNARLCHV